MKFGLFEYLHTTDFHKPLASYSTNLQIYSEWIMQGETNSLLLLLRLLFFLLRLYFLGENKRQMGCVWGCWFESLRTKN